LFNCVIYTAVMEVPSTVSGVTLDARAGSVCRALASTRPISRKVMLIQYFLPAIRQISSEFVFQQDSAPAHRALEAINSTFHCNFAKC